MGGGKRVARPGLHFPASPPGAAHARCGSRRLPAAPGAAPGAAQERSVRLPVRPPVVPGAASPSAPGAAPAVDPRDSRCGSPRLPVRLPGPAPGAAPGAAPGGCRCRSRCGSRCGRAPGLSPAHPGLTTGPGPRFPPGTHPRPRQHAPRASLDAGGGQQPPGAGGELRGGHPAHGLHVATQRGTVEGDLPGAGGGRLRAQRDPVPLQVEGTQAGFPLGAGDAPEGRTPLALPAPPLPSHEEHLEGGRAARFRRAEDARPGEADPQEAQVRPCCPPSVLTRATRARCWQGRPGHAAVPTAAVCEGRAREPFKWMWDSPSLPVLICCVALLRAATPLLPSSPEVAALQWWPVGTTSLESRPLLPPCHTPVAASLPFPSWVVTLP